MSHPMKREAASSAATRLAARTGLPVAGAATGEGRIAKIKLRRKGMPPVAGEGVAPKQRLDKPSRGRKIAKRADGGALMSDDPTVDPNALAPVSMATQAPSAVPPPAAASPPDRGVLDQLTGATGPRYQTWPERALRSAFSGATLPGDVYSGRTPVTDQYGNVSPEVMQRTQDLTSLIGTAGPPGAVTGALGMAGGKLNVSTPAGLRAFGEQLMQLGEKQETRMEAAGYRQKFRLGARPRAWYDAGTRRIAGHYMTEAADALERGDKAAAADALRVARQHSQHLPETKGLLNFFKSYPW